MAFKKYFEDINIFYLYAYESCVIKPQEQKLIEIKIKTKLNNEFKNNFVFYISKCDSIYFIITESVSEMESNFKNIDL